MYVVCMYWETLLSKHIETFYSQTLKDSKLSVSKYHTENPNKAS